MNPAFEAAYKEMQQVIRQFEDGLLTEDETADKVIVLMLPFSHAVVVEGLEVER